MKEKNFFKNEVVTITTIVIVILSVACIVLLIRYFLLELGYAGIVYYLKANSIKIPTQEDIKEGIDMYIRENREKKRRKKLHKLFKKAMRKLK